jgi:voltage-gated potassium channel
VRLGFVSNSISADFGGRAIIIPARQLLSKEIVRFSYFLDDSDRYKAVKRFFFDLLVEPQSNLRAYFDISMIVLVLASVSLLVYEIKNDLGLFGDMFEAFIVSLFISEYLLRAWVYNDSHRIVIEHYERAKFLHARFRLQPALRDIIKKKWEYIASPLAIIDLLAILPSFRSVRILRIFLLFRLFKLFRYASSVSEFAKVLSEKRFEIYTLGIFTGFLVLASSTAIYVFEGELPASHITSFFDAVYWSLVTISTVGYGDIIPRSPEGRFVTMILILSGIGVISFSTSIIVSAFSGKLHSLREHRVLAEISKVRDLTVVCGYGRIGQVVVEKIAPERKRLLIVETDANKVELARSAGYLVLHGDASDNSLLERLQIRDHVQTIVCTTGDDVANVFITLTARYLSPGLRIIARANKKESAAKLRLAGADHVVTPYETVGRTITAYVDQPVAFDALYRILSGDVDVGIEAIVVPMGSLVDGTCIEDIDFPHYRLVLFGIISAYKRPNPPAGSVFKVDSQDFYFHPPGDFVVSYDDVLIVFGDDFSLVHFRDKIGKSGLR